MISFAVLALLVAATSLPLTSCGGDDNDYIDTEHPKTPDDEEPPLVDDGVKSISLIADDLSKDDYWNWNNNLYPGATYNYRCKVHYTNDRESEYLPEGTTFTSSAPTVATVERKGYYDPIEVTGVSAGQAVISVRTPSGKTTEWTVTVHADANTATSVALCSDANHPHLIDLGEYGKWSCCNVSADVPWKYGGYYAWGMLAESVTYDEEHYPFYIHVTGYNKYNEYVDFWYYRSICWGCTYQRDPGFTYGWWVGGDNIAGSMEYDAAAYDTEGTLHIPLRSDLQKLQAIGRKVILPNGIAGELFVNDGKNVFFPYAGCKLNSSSMNIDGGYYWSSTIIDKGEESNSETRYSGAYCMAIDEKRGRFLADTMPRITGCSIRGMRNK